MEERKKEDEEETVSQQAKDAKKGIPDNDRERSTGNGTLGRTAPRRFSQEGPRGRRSREREGGEGWREMGAKKKARSACDEAHESSIYIAHDG